MQASSSPATRRGNSSQREEFSLSAKPAGLAVHGGVSLNRAVPTRVIAAAKKRGGAEKPPTAVNLAACLAAVGRQILLFDLDPQANATSGLGLEKTEGASCYRVLLG